MARGSAPSNDEERLLLLLLEDDPRFAELVRHVLAESAPEFDVQHVGRLSAALARLVRQPFSLILTDLSLPDSDGPATVRHLQRAAPGVPLVVLSGNGDLGLAMECIREGADEFRVKGTPAFQALGRLLRLALERRHRTMR
jgi:DNA-binding NtrC family response regulator